MTSISLVQLNDAIKAFLTFTDVITQGHADLTESIAETPTIQVYFDSFLDHGPEGTNRGSFGPAPIRQRPFTFYVDVLAVERNDIGADMEQVYAMADMVADKLDTVTEAPFFGKPEIKQFSWSAQRVVFEYASKKLVGIRFPLVLWVY